MMVHTCNLSCEETKPWGVQLLSHPGLLSEEKRVMRRPRERQQWEPSSDRLPAHPAPALYLRNHGSVLTTATSSPHSGFHPHRVFMPILPWTWPCPDTVTSPNWPVHITELVYLPCGWRTLRISLCIFFRDLSVDNWSSFPHLKARVFKALFI